MLAVLLLQQITLAQKTVVVDAGAGMKQEIVYDASGRVVEMRTIGADGKLQDRNVFTYPPGYYTGGLQTTTGYWPDGKSVQSIATEDYDANGKLHRRGNRQIRSERQAHRRATE